MENAPTTSHLLMVRPARFAFNEETAGNNAFQQRVDDQAGLQRQAVAEFDAYVDLLRSRGLEVTVVQDTPTPFTPDSIFPNNCFSTHHDATGRTLVLYPMFAPNRREERAKLLPVLCGTPTDGSQTSGSQMHFDRVVDLTHWERLGHYLEGTGSLILDREHHVAYACRSPRTHEEVVSDWAAQLGYDCFLFDSTDGGGMPVYHTNVVMHVGSRIAIVCLESIRDSRQRTRLRTLLEDNGKEVVPITLDQMQQFAGNMLEVRTPQGQPLLVLSTTAHRSLTAAQTDLLGRHLQLLTPHIPVIETTGGGSARCMLAEIY